MDIESEASWLEVAEALGFNPNHLLTELERDADLLLPPFRWYRRWKIRRLRSHYHRAMTIDRP